MDVHVEEKNGKWEVLTDGLLYKYYKTEPEAQDKAAQIRRVTSLMDDLKDLVKEQTSTWNEADRAEFCSWYGGITAKVLAVAP